MLYTTASVMAKPRLCATSDVLDTAHNAARNVICTLLLTVT